MLLDVFVISIVIVLIFRHSLSNLKYLEWRWLELFILAFLIQFAIVWLSFKNVEFIIKYHSILHISSFIILLISAFGNVKLPGFKLIIIGILLNFTVIVANGGQMPVSTIALQKSGLGSYQKVLEKGEYLTHKLLDKNTKLKFLADRLYIRKPYPRSTAFSVGDIIIGLGLFWLIFKGTEKKE